VRQRPSAKKFTAWHKQVAEWKAKAPLGYRVSEEVTTSHHMRDHLTGKENEVILPQMAIEMLYELTKGEAIITTGVGQHQMWAAQHYRWRHPRTMITSGGLGTMGYGLPAAIGAKVARPDALVIDIDGDASFSMTLTELSTAAEFNIGVKIVVLNNEEQGMVTQWQTLFYEDRFAHTHQKNADFVKLGHAMGIQADRVVKPDELEKKLKWLLKTDGPALLEVVTDQKVPVLPMVPSGSALHEFLVYDEATEKKRRAQTRERSGR